MVSSKKNSKKPKCYNCIHRGTVPGSAHSACEHPAAKKATDGDPMVSLVGILASVRGVSATAAAPSVQKAAENLGIIASTTGLKNGWFNWPVNFDPVWLEVCKGFKE